MRPADPARPAPDPWQSAWISWLLPGCGICISLLGVVAGVGWYAHWISLVRDGPGMPSMKINAALGFVLCGAALALMTTLPITPVTTPPKPLAATPTTTPSPTRTASGRKFTAVALSAITAALMLGTLAEYCFDVSLGLDQLLIHDYLTPADALPGRVSPLTATCFVFVAVGLMLSGL
jgi:hypothetical protein